MALSTSPPIYVGLLLLLSSGVAPFQLRTPGMCSARQATFLSEPPTLMCTEDASAVEAAPAKAAAATDASLLTTLGEARTILTCAKCKAAFPIDAEAFGSGRRVKCLNCEHEWFQTADRLQRLPESMELIEYPEKMRQRMAEGKPAEAQTNFRAFVGNLPFVATEQELEDLFAEYGCVTGVSIAKDEDGRARGFAFVNMEDPAEGNKAIEALNGHTLYDRQLNVSPGKVSRIVRTCSEEKAASPLSG